MSIDFKVENRPDPTPEAQYLANCVFKMGMFFGFCLGSVSVGVGAIAILAILSLSGVPPN